MDVGTGEGFWPDAIDTDKSAIPTLAAKAMRTKPSLARGFISERKVRLISITDAVPKFTS